MPRSPFAKLLGRVFGSCGIEFNQDTWKAQASDARLATPVQTKISSDSYSTIGVNFELTLTRRVHQLAALS